MGRGFVLLLLGERALCPSNCLYSLHAFLDGGFGKVGSFLEFLENTRALVFFLEALECAVNRFVFRNNYADQIVSPPSNIQ